MIEAFGLQIMFEDRNVRTWLVAASVLLAAFVLSSRIVTLVHLAQGRPGHRFSGEIWAHNP